MVGRGPASHTDAQRLSASARLSQPRLGITLGFEAGILEPLKLLSHENNYLKSVEYLPLEIHFARVLSRSPGRKVIMGKFGNNG